MKKIIIALMMTIPLMTLSSVSASESKPMVNNALNESVSSQSSSLTDAQKKGESVQNSIVKANKKEQSEHYSKIKSMQNQAEKKESKKKTTNKRSKKSTIAFILTIAFVAIGFPLILFGLGGI